MELLALGIGLLLPWVCGYLLLARLQGRYSRGSAESLRQLGYGFFAGYAVLYLLLLLADQVFGRVQFLPVVIGLFLLAAGLAWPYRRSPLHESAVSPASHGTATFGILAFLGLWIAVHLGLALVEVIHRPVFPWDGWLVWIYRAKAWFYHGGLLEFVSSAQWQGVSGAPTYVVDAHSYPRFASVIPLWVVTCLGEWSETLVGLPGILAGIATTMGLCTQSRLHGLSVVASLAVGYLFLSTPLIGAHLALAGYADIWMTGFVGLGFVALIGGLWKADVSQGLLGLAMVGFSLAVKSEGIVWLYLALSLVIFCRIPPRWLTLGGLVGFGLISFLILTGTSGVELPLIGVLGVVDDKLYLPFVEPQLFKPRNILDTYITSMFVHGSWNLLWVFIGLLVVLLLFSPERKLVLPVGFMIFLFAVSQWMIFGLTAQGEWATSFTAVNRVLLHLTPVMLFTACAVWHSFSRDSGGYPGNGVFLSTGPAMALAAVLTGLAVFWYLGEHTQSQAMDGRVYNSNSLSVPLGMGEKDRNRLWIRRYQDGVAIVTTGRTRFTAAELPVVDFQLETESPEAPELFWRTHGQQSEVHRLPLEWNGRHSRYMGADPRWKGTITELGIVFRGEGKSASITQLAVQPATLQHLSQAAWDDWTALMRWTQKSVNWLPAGRQEQLLHPLSIVLIWAAASLLFAAGIGKLSRRHVSFNLCLGISLLAAWMVFDIRWTGNRLQQVAHTLQHASANKQVDFLDIGRDEEIVHLVQKIKEELSSRTIQPVLVYSPHGQDLFTAYRAKYHLLPHAVRVHLGDISGAPIMQQGYVLTIDWPDTGMELETLQNMMERKYGRELELSWQDGRHALFQVDAPS